MTFALRHWGTIAIWSVLILLLMGIYAASTVSPYRTTFLSGWLLFVLILTLVMYNFRKRLPFLPLGTSTDWLQFHVSAGLLAIGLFVLHIGLRVPNGPLDVTLTLLYVAGAGSGLVGFILSRVLPRRLATRGEEVIFEQIPVMRKRLRENVEGIVERTVSEDHSTTLADFYNRRLASFLDGPRNYWGHLFASTRSRQALLTDLGALDRNLGEKERESAEELRTLIRVKDDLDCQEALQGTLKYWLFIHIPLAYSLLILSLVHAIVVSAYTTGGQ